jgi:ComF family protein
VCQDCLAAVRPLSDGVCSVCGERLVGPSAFVNDRGEASCPLCRRIEPVFARAVAYGSYNGGLRDLIHLLKYQRMRPAATVLGRMLAEAIAGLAPSFQGDCPVVVPVPLHQGKLRERGFNQSELIARSALKLKPAGLEMTLQPATLERRRATQSQTGLSRDQRRENMRGAFLAAKPVSIAGRSVLLVDDVFTTGTTVSECARILRRAGATRVWVATVARTLKAEPTAAIQPEEREESEHHQSMAAHV